MKKSLLSDIRRISVDYIPKHPQQGCYLHYCFVVQDNKILDWATNSSGEPPVHFGYHSRTDGLPKRHAEFNAFFKTKGLIDFSRSWEIVNVRLNKSGLLCNSKPCSCCFNFLFGMGCSVFWYSQHNHFKKL